MKQKKIAEGIAKFRLRHGRGHGLLDFIIQLIKNVVYLGAIGYLVNDWFNVIISKWILVLIAIGYEITCYTLGYLDEKMGFWKFENRYAAKELNPFMQELSDKIDKLHGK